MAIVAVVDLLKTLSTWNKCKKVWTSSRCSKLARVEAAAEAAAPRLHAKAIVVIMVAKLLRMRLRSMCE